MIFVNKYVKSLPSAFKVYTANKKDAFVKNSLRLCSTNAETVSHKGVRSMMNKKKNYQTEPIAWVLLVIPIGAFGLGTWQIQRKQRKEELIKNLEKRTNLPPVDFPTDLEELKDMEYFPVRVRGRFDHSKEIYVGPRAIIKEGKGYSNSQSLLSKTKAGYLVVTPFTLSDSDLTILVNRGWVDVKEKNPKTRPMGQFEGEMEIVGLVRHSEQRQPLGMKNMPEKGIWMYRDLDQMAQATGAAPILIDALSSSSLPGGPIGGQTVVGLRNEHLTYIYTWYGLCAATSYMWYMKYLKRAL